MTKPMITEGSKKHKVYEIIPGPGKKHATNKMIDELYNQNNPDARMLSTSSHLHALVQLGVVERIRDPQTGYFAFRKSKTKPIFGSFSEVSSKAQRGIPKTKPNNGHDSINEVLALPSKKGGIDKQSRKERQDLLFNFLHSRLNTTFTANELSDALGNEEINSGIYTRLSKLENLGQIIQIPNTRPRLWRVISAEKVNNHHHHNNNSHNQQPLFENPFDQFNNKIQEIIQSPALNLTETIGNITKINEQNKLYRQAFDQIANILAQLDFLDTH